MAVLGCSVVVWSGLVRKSSNRRLEEQIDVAKPAQRFRKICLAHLSGERAMIFVVDAQTNSSVRAPEKLRQKR